MRDRCIGDPPFDVDARQQARPFSDGGITDRLHITGAHGGHGFNRTGIAPRDLRCQGLCLTGGNQVLAPAMP
jgi:hypothetical protein